MRPRAELRQHELGYTYSVRLHRTTLAQVESGSGDRFSLGRAKKAGLETGDSLMSLNRSLARWQWFVVVRPCSGATIMAALGELWTSHDRAIQDHSPWRRCRARGEPRSLHASFPSAKYAIMQMLAMANFGGVVVVVESFANCTRRTASGRI